MSNYGVQPTGYVRKPLSVILAELEASMATEFGPGVIQTPQTPLGQLNGLMADLLAEIDERNLDLYQSYDPDQAEATRLNTLGRLRLLQRGSMTDLELRQAITNEGQARIDIQDLTLALRGLTGVTYAQVFVNDSGEIENSELERGFVAVAVIGGTDAEIAEVVRRHVVPGVSTYGNTYLTTNVNGFCRSVSIIRPVTVLVNVELTLKTRLDRNNCPAPSVAAIEAALRSGWLSKRQNGMDVSAYHLRSIIEFEFSNVELISFRAGRVGSSFQPENTAIPINFIEICDLNTITFVVT